MEPSSLQKDAVAWQQITVLVIISVSSSYNLLICTFKYV